MHIVLVLFYICLWDFCLHHNIMGITGIRFLAMKNDIKNNKIQRQQLFKKMLSLLLLTLLKDIYILLCSHTVAGSLSVTAEFWYSTKRFEIDFECWQNSWNTKIYHYVSKQCDWVCIFIQISKIFNNEAEARFLFQK